jgi:hypothetical protein
MNRIILIVLLTSIMMGCNTAYRSGQTPDDVYFSPSMNSGGYVVVDDERGYNADRVPMNERYLRMKTFGSRRWNLFDDDYTYWNNPYWNNNVYFNSFPNFGYGYGFSPFGNTLWRNPFSPVYYGQPVIVFNSRPLVQRNNAPRVYNLNTYTPPKSVVDPKLGTRTYRSSGSQYYNTNGTPRGGYNSNSSGSSGSPSRTFSNSSNSGSSGSSSNSSGAGKSSSGSSGTAPVRSFPRGGN